MLLKTVFDNSLVQNFPMVPTLDGF